MRISDWSSDVCSSDLHHLRAQILCDPREFGRVQAVMVPPHAHLDGHRHRHRLDTGVDQRGGQRQVAHQSRPRIAVGELRSEEHTSELQSLMRISYAVFRLKKKKKANQQKTHACTTTK